MLEITPARSRDLVWAVMNTEAGSSDAYENVGFILADYFMNCIDCPAFDESELDDHGLHPWAVQKAAAVSGLIAEQVAGMLLLHIRAQHIVPEGADEE